MRYLNMDHVCKLSGNYCFFLRWDNHTTLIRRMSLFSGDTSEGLGAKGYDVSNLPLNDSENSTYLHGDKGKYREKESTGANMNNGHPRLQLLMPSKFFIIKIGKRVGRKQPWE